MGFGIKNYSVKTNVFLSLSDILNLVNKFNKTCYESSFYNNGKSIRLRNHEVC